MLYHRHPEIILPESLRSDARKWEREMIAILTFITEQIGLYRIRGQPISELIAQTPGEDPLIYNLSGLAERKVKVFKSCVLIAWHETMEESERRHLRHSLQLIDEHYGLDEELKCLSSANFIHRAPTDTDLQNLMKNQSQENRSHLETIALAWPLLRSDNEPHSFWNRLCQATNPHCSEIRMLDPRWHTGTEKPWLPEALRHNRRPGDLWLNWVGHQKDVFFGNRA